jgi:hypothetical protein
MRATILFLLALVTFPTMSVTAQTQTPRTTLDIYVADSPAVSGLLLWPTAVSGDHPCLTIATFSFWLCRSTYG